MPKYLRLPLLKRCNTKGNFPVGFLKYYPQIYGKGLPVDEGYTALDLSLGKKVYDRLYKQITEGRIRGIIWKDKKANKWRYGVHQKDVNRKSAIVRGKSTPIAYRANRALAKIKDLDSNLWLSLQKASKLIGFAYDTLKAHFDRGNLDCYFPLADEYKKLGLDPKTKLIVKIEDLRIWLHLLASRKIISKAKRQTRHYSNKYKARRNNQRYRDRDSLAFGTYDTRHRLLTAEQREANKAYQRKITAKKKSKRLKANKHSNRE